MSLYTETWSYIHEPTYRTQSNVQAHKMMACLLKSVCRRKVWVAYQIQEMRLARELDEIKNSLDTKKMSFDLIL